MLHRNALFPILVAGVGLIAACDTAPAEAPVPGAWDFQGEVVLEADGHAVTADMVSFVMDRMPAAQRQQLEQMGQMEPMIERLALGEVLYHKAVEAKVYDDPEVAKQLAMASRQALADAYLRSQVDARLTDDAVQSAYDERKVRYAQPSADIAMLVVESGDKAADLKAQLDGGADFSALAKEHSQDPRAKSSGGEVGWVTKGQLQETLDGVVFADGADSAGILGPVEAGGMHLLVNVRERRASTPLEEVRDELESELEGQIIQEVMTELETAADVQWKNRGAAGLGEAG